jgi:prevent-host-death family protein
MKVNSTELQNNFGKYLMLTSQEDIIITRNGTEIAKLVAVNNNASEILRENVPEYSYGGKKATYEEFLELTENTEERYEYIDGEIYFLASPRTAHQIAVRELLVSFYNTFQGKKCTPMVAPYDIELSRGIEDKNIVQPDLMVICDLEEHLDERDYYKGIPGLVVEVLSKGTRRKDLIKKLDLYMSCGVGEYWLVNPENKEITIYYFKDKEIDQYATFKKGESVASFIFPELYVEVNKVFRL